MDLKVERLFGVRGKYVLVTGGGRGIGRMIVEGFAANGAVCFITSRDGGACAEAARELCQSTGGKVVALPASDLATLEGVKSCAKSLKEALLEHGGEEALDVLVNNSGVSWGAPLDTFPEVGWDKVFNTNVKGLFFLTQALVPALKKAAQKGSHASIINVGSIAGLQPQIFPTFSYDASKAAVHHLGRHLALTLAEFNITSNNLAPGLVLTKMSKGLQVYGPKEEIFSGIPLGRAGNSGDMAGVCLYFASQAGAWTTGTTVQVDGGVLVSGGQKMKSKL